MGKRKYIYTATLYRFGYDLTVTGFSEEECTNALMTEYERVYRNEHHTDPREDMRYPDTSYYDNAKEDIIIHKMELGKVEWF